MNSNELSNFIRTPQKVEFFVFFFHFLFYCPDTFFKLPLLSSSPSHYPYSFINDSLLKTLTEEIEKTPALSLFDTILNF
jgi:hypothetical protein